MKKRKKRQILGYAIYSTKMDCFYCRSLMPTRAEAIRFHECDMGKDWSVCKKQGDVSVKVKQVEI
jgi:hypothetical protein